MYFTKNRLYERSFMLTVQEEIELARKGTCPHCCQEDGINGMIVPNGSNHCFVCLVCGESYGSCKD